MKRILLIIGILSLTNLAFSQIKDKSLVATKKAAADKSGATNDIATNFYQLALKNIFGDKKELSFTTTVFGLLDSLNNKIENSDVYAHYRWARNLQINVGGKIDSNYKLTTLNGGLVYSVINKRDVTKKSHLFDKLIPIETNISQYQGDAKKSVLKKVDPTNIAKKNDTIQRAIKKFMESHDEKDLDKDFVAALVDNKTFDSYINTIVLEDSLFNLIVKEIERKPLLTIGGSYYYNSLKSNSDTFSFKSDFVVGFGNINKKLWEFTAGANMKNFKDSALSNNSLVHFETGVNKVLSVNDKGYSKMELKFFGSYDQAFSTIKTDPIFAANMTYRICLFNELWLPVTLTYDPKNGNLFGLVSITANIDRYKK